MSSSPRNWVEETIKIGIERFIEEHGYMPSATDIDECPYLPSARQIQRVYGGVVELRRKLGYGEVNFTRGELRKVIVTKSNLRGLGAEDYIEPMLISKFGEPFVHVQKRYYKGTKNRYDFFCIC